jgi:predicted Zn-dependent protease with MMP-like domain
MERQEFTKVMQEALDSLPEEFRSRIRNVAVLVGLPAHNFVRSVIYAFGT